MYTSKKVKVPKSFFKGCNFKIKLPTFVCSCGKKILDTPSNRLQSLLNPPKKKR